MDTTLRLKNRTHFSCFFCDYKCFRSNDMTKHLSTDKHQKNEREYKKNTKNGDFVTENSQKSQKVARDHNLHHYLCECGKKYKFHSGLWKHKKICNYTINDTQNTVKHLIEDNNTLKNIILEVCKNNTINNHGDTCIPVHTPGTVLEKKKGSMAEGFEIWPMPAHL